MGIVSAYPDRRRRPSGTLVAHHYDVGPPGLGKLVGKAPWTFHRRTPHKPFDVGPELFSTAYGVPAGHRLARWSTRSTRSASSTTRPAQLTFSSPANDPSYVSVPLCEQ